MPPPADSRAGRIAFTHPDFVLFEIARFLIVSAVEMQAVAVGWQVYDITKRALDLGLVGLAQFLPGILLFLASGHASDRFERRKVLAACYAGYAVCSSLLLILAVRSTRAVLPIYLVLILLGVVRSFNGTASRSILPNWCLKSILLMRSRGTLQLFRPRPSSDHPSGEYCMRHSGDRPRFMGLQWLRRWEPWSPHSASRHGHKQSDANLLRRKQFLLDCTSSGGRS
jgi:hypothetical protein